jgi:hypothetical protein
MASKMHALLVVFAKKIYNGHVKRVGLYAARPD